MPGKTTQSKSRRFLGLFIKKFKSESGQSSPTPNPSSPLTAPSASSFSRNPTPKPQDQAASEVLSAQEPMRVDRIPLPPLLKHYSTNPTILKAQEELQKEIEELQAELKTYTKKFSEYAPLQDDNIIAAVSSSWENMSLFGRVIEQVLSDQKTKSETVPGKVGSFMGQIYPIATFVLGIVSFGADAAGVLPLKITANAVNAVINTVSKQHTRSKDVLTSLPDLNKYDSFFSNLQKLGYSRISDGLLEATTKLLVAVTVSLRLSLEFLDTNRLVDAAKTLNNDKLSDAKSVLLSAVTNLDTAVNQEVLFDEKNKARREECENALNFLSDLPVLKAHDDVRNVRLKNSGSWILQDETLLKWMNGEVKTIWCPGKPGAGKTFLCSTVIDHCRSYYRPDSSTAKVVGVAWMYCSYNNQGAQTINRILASLIKQLITSSSQEKREDLMNRAISFQKEHREGSPGLQENLDLLSYVVETLDQCVVIIDALDECAEIDSSGQNRELLITKMLEFGVQLLVTSRDLPIIKDLFDEALRFGTISISPDPRDISSYIHWKIYDEAYGSPKLRKLIQKDPDLLTEITTVVKEKYSQIFNLARLQMERISRLTTCGAVREALESLPMKEADFYSHSIKRIKANESHSEQALRILAWILYSKRPIGVPEMNYAAVIVPGKYSMNFEEFALNKEDLVDCCEGLVVILPQSGTVDFAHPTVYDYLESDQDNIFNIHPNTIIASACITYLASDHLRASMDKLVDKDLTKFPLFLYAHTAWLQHTRGICEEEVLEFIIDLFRRNLSIVLFDELCYWHHQQRGLIACFKDSLTLRIDGVWIACSRGLENTARKLLKDGAILSTNEGSTKREDFELYPGEPLLVAVRRGFPAVVDVLLEFGVHVNARTFKKRMTCLHIAALGGGYSYSMLLKLLETLLSAGADMNARDNLGRTPLHISSSRGNMCVTDFLLQNRADIEERDNLGRTPLHYITEIGMDHLFGLDYIQSLLKRGANLEATNNDKWTPLHTASACGWAEAVKLFLQMGANVDVTDKLDRRAIDIARIVQAKWDEESEEEDLENAFLEQKKTEEEGAEESEEDDLEEILEQKKTEEEGAEDKQLISSIPATTSPSSLSSSSSSYSSSSIHKQLEEVPEEDLVNEVQAENDDVSQIRNWKYTIKLLEQAAKAAAKAHVT